MMRIAPLCVSAALGLAVAGCTTVDMDRLEGRYEALVRATRDRQTNLATPADLAPALIGAGSGASFLELAQSSNELAKKAGDTATRIALLRIAALSGWQSQVPEGRDAASKAADEAGRLCDAIDPAKAFKPARDCAVAKIMPMILNAESLRAGFANVSPGAELSPEEGKRRLDATILAKADFADRLPGWDQSAHIAIGGNDALGRWYDGSRWVYACTLVDLFGTPVTTSDGGLNQRLLDAERALVDTVAGDFQLNSNAFRGKCNTLAS
jgi:hypothetical protein